MNRREGCKTIMMERKKEGGRKGGRDRANERKGMKIQNNDISNGK